MRASDQTRWLLSFADLVLLLLAFFVLLHAQRANPDAVVESIGDAFTSDARPATIEHRAIAEEIFAPGEAVLRPGARTAFERLAQNWARRRGTVSITSIGRDGDAPRFDGWELAAARAAALARLMRDAGMDPQAIEIVMPPSRGREGRGGQRLLLRFTPPR